MIDITNNVQKTIDVIDITNNARNKSINGKTIDYKKNKRNIDFSKKVNKIFATTATLVIVGVLALNAPGIIQKIGESMVKTSTKLESYGEQMISFGEDLEESKKYNPKIADYKQNVYDNLHDSGYIIFDDATGKDLVKFEELAEDIVSDKEFKDIKVFVYDDMVDTSIFYNKNDLFESMAQLESKNYSNLEEYVQANGYESVDAWKKYCKDLIIEQLKKQELSQSLEEHGIDSSDLSTDQKEEMQSNYEVSSEYWVDRICNSEDPHLAFYQYYKASTKDEVYLDMIVSKFTFLMANSELNEFNIEFCETFEQYLLKNGFTDVDEWKDYNQGKLSQTEGRRM